MRITLAAMVVLLAVVAGAAAPEVESNVLESPADPSPEGQIDKHVKPN